MGRRIRKENFILNEDPERCLVLSEERREELRTKMRGFSPPPLVPDLERDLSHGWLLPILWETDSRLYGRWDYWLQCQETCALPDRPIPLLEFLSSPEKSVSKMLSASLDAVPYSASAGGGGGSGWSHFRYLLEWLLYGFGDVSQKELPPPPVGCSGASMRLYQLVNVPALQLFPYDYFGDLLAENAYGKKQGFFPTPHIVVEAMTQMTFPPPEEDARLKSVCDPCVGTGRMLLHASNRSLRLYGMDIDETLCKATRVNGYLFAPWLARPLHWLEGKDVPQGIVCGDALRDPIGRSEPFDNPDNGRTNPPPSREPPSSSTKRETPISQTPLPEPSVPSPFSREGEDDEETERWRFEENQGRLF